MNRREYLEIAGAGVGVTLAGCGDGGGGNGNEESGTTSGLEGSSTEASIGGDAITSRSAAAEQRSGTTTSDSTSIESKSTIMSADAGDTPSESEGVKHLADTGKTNISIREITVADGVGLGALRFYYESDGLIAGVRGELTNVSKNTLSLVDIQILFYDMDGMRIGEGMDSTNSLPPGKTYAFDVSYFDMANISRIASYSVIISDIFHIVL